MAKIFTFSIILAAITGLMTLGGVTSLTSANILTLFGFSPTSAPSIATTYAYIFIIATIAGAAAGSIILSGFLGRSISESYVISPIVTGIFALFVLDWISIVSYIYTAFPDMAWLGNIIGFIAFLMSVGYLVALIQFWRGNDV